MPRLPQPGGDEGSWGSILNEYLSVSHAADGTLKSQSVIDTVASKYTKPAAGIPESDLSSAVVTKLDTTGATTLDELTDVNTAGVTDGQVLAYNSGSWSAITLSGGGGVASLNDIDATAVTAPVDFNSQRLIAVGTPTAATDAATKGYVDSLSSGGNTRVSIAHSGGALNLDHSAGNYFDVTATGNITSVTESNSPSVGDFLMRIQASGGTITLDLSALEIDSATAGVTSLNDGEYLIVHGVIF